MKWIGTQTIYDNVRFVKGIGAVNGTGTLPITAGDITLYDATNDGNPTISLGSSATNRFEITSTYNSGTQTLLRADLKTYTSSSTANDGKIMFWVDEVLQAAFIDNGLNFVASKNISFNNIAVLSDSSGTTTLSNIDALDATTIATFETAMEANLDTFGSQMTSASALATVGTIGTGVWQGTAITAAYIAAAQTNITSLGTLTNLQVDDINLNDKTISIVGDAEDTFSIVTGAAGATTLTTTDDNAAAGHFEIAADGDIILDSAGQIKLEPVAGNNILLDGTIAIDAGVVTGATSITSTAFVGDVSGGAWTGTAIASAYLDADTAHNSLTKQMTHHTFTDDMDTTKQYIGLTEADAENTNTANKFLPFPAIVAGKLLKVALRSNKNLTGHTLTWRLETISSGANFGSTPAIIGTQSGAGCNSTTMTTYDFSGVSSNAVAVGDAIHLSLQSNVDFGSNVIYYVTCLWEWDLS